LIEFALRSLAPRRNRHPPPHCGAHPFRYAQESSGRQDNYHVSDGDQLSRVAALAMKRGKSHDFGGYWHRHFAD